MAEPIGLLDLAPNYEDVPIAGDQTLRVYGLSTQSIFDVVKRHAGLQQLLSKSAGFGFGDIVAIPGALNSIIAAACGHPGNEEAEAKAALLSMSDQTDLFSAIWRLTFTRGFGPFVLAMERFRDQASAPRGNPASMNSQRPLRPAKPSQPPAQASG